MVIAVASQPFGGDLLIGQGPEVGDDLLLAGQETLPDGLHRGIHFAAPVLQRFVELGQHLAGQGTHRLKEGALIEL